MLRSNSGKFRDRNPDYVAAGKSFGLGGTAQDCLSIEIKPRTPEFVHKYRCTTQPAAGKRRIFYGRYNDPAIAECLSHGISTKPSYVAGQLVNPNPKSFFTHRLDEKREDSVYASRRRAPLGKSHDQREGLPEGHGPNTQRYGIPTMVDGSASELVSPAKSRKQVEHENSLGLDLYKKSHNKHAVGETYDRKYDWSRVPSTSCFGVETPHDNRGLNTKKTFKWLHETLSDKAAQITSKRVDDFRERSIPQVGVVHDPIKDTMNVSNNHVYGIMVKPDQYGAGDLIHMRDPANFLRGKDRQRGILAAVRHHLKKANYQNFADLKAAFSFYDKDKSGTINLDKLRSICQQFNLPVQTELLEALLASCDKDKDAQINYVEFANFLNWKDKMPTGLSTDQNNNNNPDRKNENIDSYEQKIIEEAMESGVDLSKTGLSQLNRLGKQIDTAHGGEYTTSASMINGNVLSDFTKTYQPNGVPTIRSDRPAPRIRRIGDNTNYGDESDAYGLINPSIYSNYGVFEEDFFKKRDPHVMRRIFDSIGVEMTNDTFQQLWERARNNTPNGEVSVESFRNILDEKLAEEFEKATNIKDPTDVRNIIDEMTSSKPDIYKQFDNSNITSEKKVVMTA